MAEVTLKPGWYVPEFDQERDPALIRYRNTETGEVTEWMELGQPVLFARAPETDQTRPK